jgi:hypothetical protein
MPKLTPDEEALLRGLWVQHRRLLDVAEEIGLSERQAGRRLRAAGVEMPGSGRPKGVKDSPWCDRQQAKRTRSTACEEYEMATPFFAGKRR